MLIHLVALTLAQTVSHAEAGPGAAKGLPAPIGARSSNAPAAGTSSPKAPGLASMALPAPVTSRLVCSSLVDYPKAIATPLAFEAGEVSALCRARFPALKRERLDLCGDWNRDPYASSFTWPTSVDMKNRGKTHLLRDPEGQRLAQAFRGRIEEIRRESTDFCCGPNDLACRSALERLDVGFCQSGAKPGEPDPCVFGGNYRMPGETYPLIFAELARAGGARDPAIRRVVARNLGSNWMTVAERRPDPEFPYAGSIRLTSYAPLATGTATLEPTLRHELGHACSMIKMQIAAADRAPARQPERERAARWLDGVKGRCDATAELSDAYGDLWESMGESRELAACFVRLAKLNRDRRIDKPCSQLCPGHYLEESVGVAFSLLTGDLDGTPSAVFPNTCDHVRDGQHPMVSDVVDCLAQHSPRFRSRLAAAQGCSAK